MKASLFENDAALRENGIKTVCGVDEAGRGPLAGPVYAAAVILPPDLVIDGLDDSKKLSEMQREKLFDRIIKEALAYGIAWADEREIDEQNILNATMDAMFRAVNEISFTPDIILIDGNKAPPGLKNARCVIGGDATHACIAAASIIAKVSRDRLMCRLDLEYPEYMFAKHKGYGTKLHYEALEKYGPCRIHRLSFLKSLKAAKL